MACKADLVGQYQGYDRFLIISKGCTGLGNHLTYGCLKNGHSSSQMHNSAITTTTIKHIRGFLKRYALHKFTFYLLTYITYSHRHHY